MSILLASTDFWEDMDVWSNGLQKAMPEMDIKVYPDDGDVKEVEASIIERDRKDSTRDDSPLTEASGSIVVDTSGFSINEVVEHILGMLPHDQG
jgi:cytidylate kinase